jgi:hypothetical protein
LLHDLGVDETDVVGGFQAWLDWQRRSTRVGPRRIGRLRPMSSAPSA